MSEYIRNTIIDFFNNSNILLTDDIIGQIEKQVQSGAYAFQIIYTPNEHSTLMNFELAKPLDYKLVNKVYDIYSYDGGKNYKYDEYETLIFNPSVIRNIKLDDLGI